MSTQTEIYRIKKQGMALKYATLSIAAIAVMGAVFLVGGREGYGYAVSKIRQAVAASEYPTVKVVWPSKEAIAIKKGGICTPIIPTLHIPEFAHIEYVSPDDRPCGAGKPGQPYQDSAALQAIQNKIAGLS